MRLRHFHDSLAKTLAFALVHLAIAVTLGWLLTGAFVLGGLVALVEPLFNTVVGHQIERHAANRGRLFKSALLTVSHLIVAVGTGWWLTGSLAVAGLYAVIEPVANGVAHYFFDGWWHGRRGGMSGGISGGQARLCSGRMIQ